MRKIMLMVILCSIISGCARVPLSNETDTHTSKRIGPQYSANTNTKIKVFVYAERTLVQTDDGERLQFWLPDGTPIQAEWIGNRYYQLDRLTMHFFAGNSHQTIEIKGNPVTMIFNTTGVHYMERPGSVLASVPQLQ